MRLGDLLVASEAIDRPTLEQAVARQRGRLGEFLRAHGLLDGRALADALARQHTLARADILSNAPDASLFVPRDVPAYLAHRYVPYQRAHDGTLTLACVEPDAALQDFARAHYGASVRFALATPRELSHYLGARGAISRSRTARLALRRRFRHLAADRVLLPHQMRGLLLLVAMLATLCYAAPSAAWQGVLIAMNAFYAASLLVKTELLQVGLRRLRTAEAEEEALATRAAALAEDALPHYTILVPLYRERETVLMKLLAGLRALDYPREKLEIKLVCEASDTATIETLRQLAPPPMMEIVVTPTSTPRTKPKACNYALGEARGEYVVIFDAEDTPAPDQLRRAVAQFQVCGPEVACLQAPLTYFNRPENLLTRLFAIEYSALFRLMLPALAALGLPIPLGGTSNHLRRAALLEVGGWDAFNVTEDADLGVRLHYFGYRTAMLASATREEAPITLRAWMKQRTRWIKGYLQTWLVYMRDGAALKARIGRPAYYGFQFFIGAPALTFLLAPVFWGICLLSLLGALPLSIPNWLWGVCAASFLGSVGLHWLYARAAIRLEDWDGMRLALVLYPFYWLLHSFAAARAVVQLLIAPHYWDKTTHGVSRFSHRGA